MAMCKLKCGESMEDRELVITHLTIIHTWAAFARERDLQFLTPKHLEDIAKWSDDAIDLLKEQQPMLIDVNQMKQLADGTDVWLEAKDDREVFALTMARPWIGYYLDRVENGTYRCWTARPTDEQKKSVPWTNT